MKGLNLMSNSKKPRNHGNESAVNPGNNKTFMRSLSNRAKSISKTDALSKTCFSIDRKY
jgi:hypothetical protein